jgi:molecular chaperone GrpE
MAEDREKQQPEEQTQPSSADQPPDEEPQADEPESADERSALEQEKQELFERLQRVSADYQNYMKRSEQGRTDAVNLALADALKAFLPVLDHFDRALETTVDSDDAKALHQGMRIVRDEFLKALQQVGVERLEVEPGEVFDPHRHEALMRQPAEGVEPNHVTAQLQPGYVFRGRVLRAAKVAVAPAEE